LRIGVWSRGRWISTFGWWGVLVCGGEELGIWGFEYHSAGVGKLWKLWALVGVRMVVRRAMSHVRVRDCIVTVLYKYG
jgi:hypothetical protein